MLKLFLCLTAIIGFTSSFECESEAKANTILCEPRAEVVRVSNHGFPQFALIQRCGGNCANDRACIPTAFHTTNISVVIDDKCGTIHAIEHDACGCECVPVECSDLHSFNSKTCQCQCDFTEECAEGFDFDEETCSCRCESVEKCNANQVFEDTVLCKCVDASFFDHE